MLGFEGTNNIPISISVRQGPEGVKFIKVGATSFLLHTLFLYWGFEINLFTLTSQSVKLTPLVSE